MVEPESIGAVERPPTDSIRPAAVPARPRVGGRRRRCLALAGVFPASLVLCELAVRVLGLGPAPRPEVFGTVVRPISDPVLRFITVPSSERVVVYPPFGDDPGRRVVQRLNRQGFRGPTVALPKAAQVLRIVCVGDSHTFGEGVEDRETWPLLLGGLLRENADRPIEVVNAGVQGYDTAQEARWIEHFVLPLEPDIVLLQFFINDANNPGARRARATQAATPWWLKLAHPRQEGAVHWLRHHSRLADALLEAAFRRNYFDHWGEGNAHFLVDDDLAWREWCQAMERIDRMLREAKVPLAVVLYPFMHAPGGEFASHDVHRRVAEHLATVGIACLDAEPAFSGRDPVALRVHPGDMHAGAEANGIFAAAVADWIEGWPPFAAGAFTTGASPSPAPTSHPPASSRPADRRPR
ncbi:SGNH/GDSL hydrolase family protein [Engelhardtia mirabilis]|uniref:SGNH hydrolase-type esterase domain-containing protein n=1 Tax=Engelhardtia mirabilis TaxID=2528011 RepID=A0A518BM04_9BACT|nr:hypothetical protein Pla133_30840 [Planctomycetes bacterium Pla133]QDV02319.1 hypothetical protein Pla86_30830 [Planctomycetes bacterium Pla86]